MSTALAIVAALVAAIAVRHALPKGRRYTVTLNPPHALPLYQRCHLARIGEEARTFRKAAR